MIYYLDTSALVKKYVLEPGSDELLEIWRQAEALCVSVVAYAEASAAFHRRSREGSISPEALRSIQAALRRDWQGFVQVPVSPALNRLVDRLVARHPLRGFDAIHLASAYSLKATLKQNLTFVCSDKRLLDAAAAEKLRTLGCPTPQ